MGIEPLTFGVQGECLIHYTTEDHTNHRFNKSTDSERVISMNTIVNPLFRCLVRMVIITHRANTELTCEFLINEVNQYLQWNNASRPVCFCGESKIYILLSPVIFV